MLAEWLWNKKEMDLVLQPQRESPLGTKKPKPNSRCHSHEANRTLDFFLTFSSSVCISSFHNEWKQRVLDAVQQYWPTLLSLHAPGWVTEGWDPQLGTAGAPLMWTAFISSSLLLSQDTHPSQLAVPDAASSVQHSNANTKKQAVPKPCGIYNWSQISSELPLLVKLYLSSSLASRSRGHSLPCNSSWHCRAQPYLCCRDISLFFFFFKAALPIIYTFWNEEA